MSATYVYGNFYVFLYTVLLSQQKINKNCTRNGILCAGLVSLLCSFKVCPFKCVYFLVKTTSEPYHLNVYCWICTGLPCIHVTRNFISLYISEQWRMSMNSNLMIYIFLFINTKARVSTDKVMSIRYQMLQNMLFSHGHGNMTGLCSYRAFSECSRHRHITAALHFTWHMSAWP